MVVFSENTAESLRSDEDDGGKRVGKADESDAGVDGVACSGEQGIGVEYTGN